MAFAVAAAAGAVARYVIDGAVSARRAPTTYPWGTFVVNATGSLLSGFITGLALYHSLATTPRLVLATGFCGAYTTFSTFTYETVRLLEEGTTVKAAANLAATALTCAAAAGLGLALASL